MIDDLALCHRPVTDLFAQPESRDQWEQYRLDDEQVARFHRDGFLPGIRMLDDAQIETLRNQLDGLFNPHCLGHELFHEYHSNESTDPNTVLFHALGAWRIAPAFHDLLWNPAFLVPASQLLGGAVRFWHDQLFCKPARHGGVVAWHQDYSYWTRTVPMAHLTCWIGLDDATAENGCVHYIPGSQQWKLLPITGLAGGMDSIQTVLTDEQRARFKPVAAELKKGYAVFHDGLTVHGSYENRTDRPRRAAVLNVFRDGVTSASDRPPLKGVPPVPPGEPMGGTFFPFLFDPESLG